MERILRLARATKQDVGELDCSRRLHAKKGLGEVTLIDEAFSDSWVPWEAYGVTPTDIDGCSLTRVQVNDCDLPVSAASDLGLTVLSPVQFTVCDGAVTIAGLP